MNKIIFLPLFLLSACQRYSYTKPIQSVFETPITTKIECSSECLFQFSKWRKRKTTKTYSRDMLNLRKKVATEKRFSRMPRTLKLQLLPTFWYCSLVGLTPLARQPPQLCGTWLKTRRSRRHFTKRSKRQSTQTTAPNTLTTTLFKICHTWRVKSHVLQIYDQNQTHSTMSLTFPDHLDWT